MNKSLRWIVASMVLAGLIVAMSRNTALAQQATDNTPPTREEAIERKRQATRERLWQFHFPRYAKRFQKWNDGFYFMPAFNARNDSSLNRTSKQLEDEYTIVYVVQTKRGAITRKKTVDSPKEDVETVRQVLPRYKPGEYGYIHNCVVKSVSPNNENENETVVGDIQTLDWSKLERLRSADRSWIGTQFRKIGGVRTSADDYLKFRFRYRDLIKSVQQKVDQRNQTLTIRGVKAPVTPGNKWPGPLHLAIISEEDGKLLAVPVKQLEPVRKQETFITLLELRGVTKEQFLNEVEQALELALEKRLPIENLVDERMEILLSEKMVEEEFDLNTSFDL